MDGRTDRVIRRVVVLAVTAVMAMTLVSACVSPADPETGSPVHHPTTTSPPTTAVTRLSDRISLSSKRVVAGTPIKGAFIVNNLGGPLHLLDSSGCQQFFGVTLTTLAFAAPCLSTPLTVRHGTNRFPVTAITTYQQCLPPGGSSSVSVPACVSGNLSPLPAGIYHAKLVSQDIDLPTPQPVTVTLTR